MVAWRDIEYYFRNKIRKEPLTPEKLKNALNEWNVAVSFDKIENSGHIHKDEYRKLATILIKKDEPSDERCKTLFHEFVHLIYEIDSYQYSGMESIRQAEDFIEDYVEKIFPNRHELLEAFKGTTCTFTIRDEKLSYEDAMTFFIPYSKQLKLEDF